LVSTYQLAVKITIFKIKVLNLMVEESIFVHAPKPTRQGGAFPKNATTLYCDWTADSKFITVKEGDFS
jgi:hypothetical protein